MGSGIKRDEYNEKKNLDDFLKESDYYVEAPTLSKQDAKECYKRIMELYQLGDKLLVRFVQTLMAALLIGVGIFLFLYLVNGNQSEFNGTAFGIAAIILCIIIFIPINIKDKKLNTERRAWEKKLSEGYEIPTIKKILAPYQYSKKGIPEDFFKKTFAYKKLKKYQRYRSSDKISGVWEDKEFVMAYLHLNFEDPYGTTGSRGNMFDGVFLKMRISNFFDSCIYIKSKLKYFNFDYEDDEKDFEEIQYKDIEEIKNDFEDKFEILEDKKKMNTEILDENFMIQLLKLQEKYGVRISVIILNNVANVLINDFYLPIEDLTNNELSEETSEQENEELNKDEALLGCIESIKEIADAIKDFKLKK